LDTDAFCLRCKDRGIAIEWSSSMPHLRECRRFSDDSRRSRLGIWSGTLVSALRGSLCPPYGDPCVRLTATKELCSIHHSIEMAPGLAGIIMRLSGLSQG
jgi:hypothetical protein